MGYCAEDRLVPTGTVLGQGRCARVEQRQMRGSMVLQTVVVPQLQSIEDRRHPFRAAESDSHGPVCSEDHRVSSIAVRCQVVDAPVMQVVFHARCCTTGAQGSDSAELRGSAAVAVPSWLWTSL